MKSFVKLKINIPVVLKLAYRGFGSSSLWLSCLPLCASIRVMQTKMQKYKIDCRRVVCKRAPPLYSQCSLEFKGNHSVP